MISCDAVCQAAMALADGETPALEPAQVQLHLAQCVECRRRVEELRSLNHLFADCSRRVQAADLWPAIQASLAPHQAPARRRGSAAMFLMLVIMLLLVRGVVLAGSGIVEWVARAVALLLVLGWVLLLRENPFAIHPHLIEYKDTRS
jgi:anti-sigma factor RsiW